MYKYPDGSTYEGDYKDDKKHGKGIFRYGNGDVYDGNYKDDMRDGLDCSPIHGDIYKGNYVMGKGMTRQLPIFQRRFLRG